MEAPVVALPTVGGGAHGLIHVVDETGGVLWVGGVASEVGHFFCDGLGDGGDVVGEAAVVGDVVCGVVAFVVSLPFPHHDLANFFFVENFFLGGFARVRARFPLAF